MTVVVTGGRRLLVQAIAAGLRSRGVTAAAAELDGPHDMAEVLVVEMGGPLAEDDLRRLIAGAPDATVLTVADVQGSGSRIGGAHPVPLSADLDALEAAIERALAGALVEDRTDQTRGGPAPQAAGLSAAQERLLARLTTREVEVLRALLDVGSNDAIADRLDISVNTVRTHVGRLLKKLGVANRYEAAAVARRAGVPAMSSARGGGVDGHVRP